MSEKLLDIIVQELKCAKYFSIIVDSTPDVVHIDQLSLVLRYVKNDDSPVERFVMFVPNSGHNSDQLAEVVHTKLKSCDTDISNCRGQSYDNARNMSGICTGLQARIKDVNPLTDYMYNMRGAFLS